jgi:hypothetical protein
MLALELESAYQRCVRCGSKKMAFRPEGEMKIPGKLTASPLCAPARVSGLRYAHPVPKRSVPQGREGNHYPLNHPLRQRAHAEATAQRAAREMERANAMSVLIETRMVRLSHYTIIVDVDMRACSPDIHSICALSHLVDVGLRCSGFFHTFFTAITCSGDFGRREYLKGWGRTRVGVTAAGICCICYRFRGRSRRCVCHLSLCRENEPCPGCMLCGTLALPRRRKFTSISPSRSGVVRASSSAWRPKRRLKSRQALLERQQLRTRHRSAQSSGGTVARDCTAKPSFSSKWC